MDTMPKVLSRAIVNPEVELSCHVTDKYAMRAAPHCLQHRYIQLRHGCLRHSGMPDLTLRAIWQ